MTGEPQARWLDRRAAQRAFDRAAERGAESFIAREIEQRMAERLEYIRHAPTRILEAGCGAGQGVALLRAKYPQAEIVALDRSGAMLRAARAPGSFVARLRDLPTVARVRAMPMVARLSATPMVARLNALAGGAVTHYVQADLAAAALRPASCDMLWSNLALAWCDDAPATLQGWGATLRSEALAMFTTFGPDTLRELAGAFRAADTGPHVHPFVDMHDIGDMLLAAGFAEPVIDMEAITLTYKSPGRLLSELRAAGYVNAHAGRRRTLGGAAGWRRMLAAYESLARDGRVPATFEVVYAHAWKAAPRTASDGRTIVRFDALGSLRKSA